MTNKNNENELILRPMNLKEDYDKLVPFYDMIFERELSIKGGSIKLLLNENRAFLPFTKILGVFSKNYKHIFDGFVYENQQQEIVSTVNIGFSGDYWEIAMVATHPNYRKRGLARNLIDVSLKHAKKHNGQICILEVLEENTPAYNLYKSLGFTHFDTMIRLNLDYETLADLETKNFNVLKEYSITEAKRDKKSNQECYNLELRATPNEIQSFIPVNKIKYFKPLILRLIVPLIKLFIKMKANRWIVKKGDEVIGLLFTYFSKSDKSFNEINIIIDPAYEKSIAEMMIKFALNQIKENSEFKVNTIINSRKINAYQLEILLDNGFKIFETNHILGLMLKNQ